jgi:hypothetical protein
VAEEREAGEMVELDANGNNFAPIMAPKLISDYARISTLDISFILREKHWRLHPAQKAMVENTAINVSVVNSEEIKKPLDAFLADRDMTLFGVPVWTDAEMPEDEIRFENDKGGVIARIFNLAKPEGF